MKGGEGEDDFWKGRREKRYLKTETEREETQWCVCVCVRNQREINLFIYKGLCPCILFETLFNFLSLFYFIFLERIIVIILK